jgi:hypothetical protein
LPVWVRNLTLALVPLWLQADALAQAAAESVLLGSTTSTATIKAGTSLNSSYNKASAQTANRVQHVTHPVTGRVPVRTRRGSPAVIQHPPVGPTSGQTTGSVVASVQGTSGNCTPKQSSCSAAAKNQTKKKYQSVITLPPAK